MLFVKTRPQQAQNRSQSRTVRAQIRTTRCGLAGVRLFETVCAPDVIPTVLVATNRNPASLLVHGIREHDPIYVGRSHDGSVIPACCSSGHRFSPDEIYSPATLVDRSFSSLPMNESDLARVWCGALPSMKQRNTWALASHYSRALAYPSYASVGDVSTTDATSTRGWTTTSNCSEVTLR